MESWKKSSAFPPLLDVGLLNDQQGGNGRQNPERNAFDCISDSQRPHAANGQDIKSNRDDRQLGRGNHQSPRAKPSHAKTGHKRKRDVRGRANTQEQGNAPIANARHRDENGNRSRKQPFDIAFQESAGDDDT